MDAGYFKGTSADQDNRFVDKNKKLMKTMKFGEALEKKVDMTRVDMEIIRPWINKTITDYLGDEDDVVVEFICNQLDAQSPDGRQMQMNVMGFLGAKNAREFIQKLWQLLLSAMDDICGIPAELKEQKKEQIRIKQEEQGRLNENLRTQQSIIQEAIAKIKVNAAAAAAAINNRSLAEQQEKPGRRGRLTVGLSRSGSPSGRDAKAAGKGAKATESFNAQTKATDRSEETAEAPPGGQKKQGMGDASRDVYDRRRKPSLHGRNRIQSPSPRKERWRSREQSPYRKSSPRRRTRSPDSTRKDLSHRRSPSPHHPKVSPSRQRTFPSRHQRSLTPDRHGGHSLHHRPSHDGNQRRPLPNDARGDTPNKTSQGRSESSDSQRFIHERSQSRASSTENIRDGKTLEKLSVFHHRNYRSHRGGRQSSPEDAGVSPKTVNPRGSKNGNKKSFAPALAVRNEFSPQRKHSPRYSSSAAHRHSPRQSQAPEGDSYAKLEPIYSSRRLSPHLSLSRSQRRSLSFSPERRSQDQRWVSERRRASPTSKYGYQEMPRLAEGLTEPAIRRSRNVSPGYCDNWGSSSKWDEVEPRSRHRSPRTLPERCTRSPLVERRGISPFPTRYIGQHEGHWPLSPCQDPRVPADNYRTHVGAPRYDRPREDFDRGQKNTFNRGISHNRKRHGDSPFRRAVPYNSDVRELTGDYYADLPPSRVPPGLDPVSPVMARHSRAYVRSSGPQRRDDYAPRGVRRGDRYPTRGPHLVEHSYDPPRDKFNPHFERRGNSYDRLGGRFEPHIDRFDPRGGGQAGNVYRTQGLADKGEYNLHRGNYNSPREDRIFASHEDLPRYPPQRSRSHSPHKSRPQDRSRSPKLSRSPNRSRSPRWTNRKAWIEENMTDSALRTSERDHRGSVLSRAGQFADKERTEHEGFKHEPKYQDIQQREISRSLKRARSPASSSPDGVSRSSSHARNLLGSVDRQGVSVEQYNYHGSEEDSEEKRNKRYVARSMSPSSLPPLKKLKVEEEDAVSTEASEAEVGSSKKKKKKKEKKKKRKKHKKHKKHKHKRSQEDENEDESNTDHDTQDDEVTSHTPESRSNALEDEQEHELRVKAILSLKTSK